MIEHITALLMPFTAWMFFASLKSAVVIPLVLLVRRISARWLTPQGRYGLWLAVIACLAIPFGAQVNMRDETRITAAPATAQVAMASSVTTHEQPIITIGNAPEESASSPAPQTLAVLVWLLGVAALTAVVICNTIRYARINATASTPDPALVGLFDSCRQALQIRRHVRILETTEVESPVLVGYWRPALLLPRNLSTQIDKEQLRLVLLHELTHLERHDILANWLITCVQIAHWFNPLAWYALRVARHDMEQACDADVLRRLTASERIEYGKTLINLSDLTPHRTLLVQNASVVESRSQLTSRIRMIAQFKSRGVFNSLLGAALIALTSMIAVTQAAGTTQQPLQALPATAPTVQKQAAPQAKTGTGTSTEAIKPPASATKQKASDEPMLEAAYFPIKHAMAKDLAAFIRSAPGGGLLSYAGSIAIDESTNTLMVHDTAANVAAIRQLVVKLDAPVEQVLLEAQFVLLDDDLLQELRPSGPADGKASPLIYPGTDKSALAALEAGEKAHRAELISAPRVVMANRQKTSIEHSAGLPPGPDAPPNAPARTMHLKLGLTPTVMPDMRIQLDIDAAIDLRSTVVITAGGPGVPSIDNRETQTKIFLESGATAILDFTGMYGPGTSGAGTGAEHKRLVAFVTLRRIPAMPPGK